mmetsp:Transcript_18377/g.59277  ORF Transcript_18377/g.59277 Transcript_18377/m.59277 type:complete len:735 (-) Transcript_18377:380-2584(-)
MPGRAVDAVRAARERAAVGGEGLVGTAVGAAACGEVGDPGAVLSDGVVALADPGRRVGAHASFGELGVDIRADVAVGAVVAIGSHELRPGRRERLLEFSLVVGEVLGERPELFVEPKVGIKGRRVERAVGTDELVAVVFPGRCEGRREVVGGEHVRRFAVVRREGRVHLSDGVGAEERDVLRVREARDLDHVLDDRQAVVAVAHSPRFEVRGAFAVGRVRTTAAEWNVVSTMGFETYVSGQDDEIRPGERVAVLVLDGLEQCDGVGEAGVDVPVAFRRVKDPRAVRAAAVVRDSERAGRTKSQADEGRAVSAGHISGGFDRRFNRVEVRELRRWIGQRELEVADVRYIRTEATGDRAHVSRRQLVPRLGEGGVQNRDVRGELLHDGSVVRIDDEGDVRRVHRDRLRTSAVGEGRDDIFARLAPDSLARRTDVRVLRKVEVDEVLGVEVGPIRGRGRPRRFEAARRAVRDAVAGAAEAGPRIDRIFGGRQTGTLGAGAVALAEGMAAGDECRRFAVVHSHPFEARPRVLRGAQEVRRVAAGSAGIDVDEFHLRRAEGPLAEGLAFGAGRDLLLLLRGAELFGPEAVGFVDASRAEAHDGATHHFDGRVAREDDEVAPGQAEAVLEFDGPQDAARLVELDVVDPGALGVDAISGAVAAAEAVGFAVGAGAVPGEANHEGAVVAEVRRPEVLGGRERVADVRLDGVPVEGFDGFAVAGRLRRAPRDDGMAGRHGAWK